MFIGPKISTVFRSRWSALFWAAGVMFSAYWMVPGHDDDSGNAGGKPDPTAMAIVGALGGQSAAPAPVSPWAKQPDPAPAGQIDTNAR